MSTRITQDEKSWFIDQSVHENPCRVRFAGNDSLISLSKWQGEATLHFGRGGEYSGEVKTSRNELLLKPDSTPKAHHVFRKLDGEHFEYDVILLREPETNVIDISLDFPDGLEFYRQLSLEDALTQRVKCPPELIDSYAVYWKKRNGKYKTGKFCHIYRPLIYDARGRKVWGRLLLHGNLLRITIPEEWLSDAAYPVVVDPVVGTQVRGAYNTVMWDDPSSTQKFRLRDTVAINDFIACDKIVGPCTSYIYTYAEYQYPYGQPCIYDSKAWMDPGKRISRDETITYLSASPVGWKASPFTLSEPLVYGGYYWFGYRGRREIMPYFDLGSVLYTMNTDIDTDVPDNFINNGNSYSALLSMYFTYSLACEHVRSLFDTIGLEDAVMKKLSVHRRSFSTFYLLETATVARFLYRLCLSVINIIHSTGISRILHFLCRSGFWVWETIARHLVLKKEELVFVSRISREIEFKGYLL